MIKQIIILLLSINFTLGPIIQTDVVVNNEIVVSHVLITNGYGYSEEIISFKYRPQYSLLLDLKSNVSISLDIVDESNYQKYINRLEGKNFGMILIHYEANILYKFIIGWA